MHFRLDNDMNALVTSSIRPTSEYKSIIIEFSSITLERMVIMFSKVFCDFVFSARVIVGIKPTLATVFVNSTSIEEVRAISKAVMASEA